MTDHHSTWRTYTGPRSLRRPLASTEQQSQATLFVAVVCMILGTLAILPGLMHRPKRQGPLTACKSNLKNIGTAMEMYSTDWQGHYPNNLAALTPAYLIALPQCPVSRSQSYRLQTGPKAGYNTQGYEDYYVLQCQGENHKRIRLAPNFPQYDCLQGLIEGPRI